MVAIKIAPFKGMLPAVDDTLLPDGFADTAQNAWLYSGVLQPMRVPVAVKTLSSTSIVKAFRIPRSFLDKDSIYNSDWLEFTNPDTDVVRSPLASDSFERYYWASSSGVPQYNTKARIIAGSPAYTLGVPTPAAAPSVVAAGGVSGTTRTVSYVYCYVTSMGEVGAPSPAFTLTGKVDDTWTVTLPVYAPPATTPVVTTRIFRTVTSNVGVATYFFVADVAVATTTYADTRTDAAVTAGAQMVNTNYTPPPADLQGLVSMSNGMIAGWRGNEVWFCEPYLPHAWPAAYSISVDYPIVGMGVVGQTLIVCTSSSPYAITGVNPSTMSMARLATVEPCLSRGSIVSAPEGVYYSAPSGIVRADAGIAVPVTSDIVTKDQWLTRLTTSRLRAARLGSAYYTYGAARAGVFEPTAFETTAFTQTDFTGARNGALIDLTASHASWVELVSVDPILNVFSDPWTGEVLFIRNGVVYLVDVSASASYGTAVWRSKIYQTSQKKNLGACRVNFSVPAGTPAQITENTTQPQPTLGANQYALLRVYADGNLIVTREVRKSGEVMRFPSGFKADYWQVEIETRVAINSIELASSPRELASV